MTVNQMAGLVRVEGNAADGGFLILCDHASNRLPAGFGDIGLNREQMIRHIAWDPGALAVARGLAARLGSPLLYPDASRLVIDCNRPVSAPDSIAELSEDTAIPGNRDLPQAVRSLRIARIYTAYHDAIANLLDAREGRPTALVAVHSFTPVYRGTARPWHAGIVFDRDRRLADPLLSALRREPDLAVGENVPYSPADGVYHTLERHSAARTGPAVMIEIRNDLIADAEGQKAWASRLGDALHAAVSEADRPAA